MVVARVARCRWVEADSLDATARGAGGFGSSGQR
jgi:dUTPase